MSIDERNLIPIKQDQKPIRNRKISEQILRRLLRKFAKYYYAYFNTKSL